MRLTNEGRNTKRNNGKAISKPRRSRLCLYTLPVLSVQAMKPSTRPSGSSHTYPNPAGHDGIALYICRRNIGPRLDRKPVSIPNLCNPAAAGACRFSRGLMNSFMIGKIGDGWLFFQGRISVSFSLFLIPAVRFPPGEVAVLWLVAVYILSPSFPQLAVVCHSALPSK